MRLPRTALLLVLSATLLAGSAACQSGRACVPNQVASCVCDDGQLGSSVCAEDGSALGPCGFCGTVRPDGGADVLPRPDGPGDDRDPGDGTLPDRASDGTDPGDGGPVPDVPPGDGAPGPDLATDGGGNDGGGGGDGGDGGGDLGGGTCGQETCRIDQQCLAGRCTFACPQAGAVAVPGDHATLQGAVDALDATGGRICVGEKSDGEAVSISLGAGLSLEITGLDGRRSVLGSLTITGQGANASLSITGLGVSGGSSLIDNDGTITLLAGRFRGTGGGPAVFLDRNAAAPAEVIFDGCDLSGGQSTALTVFDRTATGPAFFWDIRVLNSHVHDSADGLHVANLSQNQNNALIFRSINNTLTGISGVAFGVTGESSRAGFRYFNNAYVGNGTGIRLDGLTPDYTPSHNALFANGTNFAGIAANTAGEDDVLVDPQLDTSSAPPGLLPGSPLRGAGLAVSKTAVDFFGTPRGASFDIGAVQSTP